jgi:hypothetical protein
MPLKYKFKSKDEIPAEVLAHYVERDGAWMLDIDGVVDKSKLDEFRANNVGLMKQLEEQRKRFEGIDPEQVKALMEEKRKLEEAQAMKDGQVDKLLDSRVRSFKAELEKQISALASERDSLGARLMEIQINQGVIEAANKRGLRRTAIPDITARARNVFKLVNGVPTALDADGKTVRYGKDGVTPMTLEEWADAQVQEAPHLFESNAGGGAPGSGSGGVVFSDNPWKQESFNLTKQGQIMKKDPALARALMTAAGTK